MKKVNDSKRTYMLITIPILALFVCFNTVPLIRGVIYSFTNFKGFGTYDFIGFRNYLDLFTDPRIGGSYLFTIKLAIVATILTNVISLILALGLNSKIKGKTFLRAAYFVPNVLGALVVGYIFQYISSPTSCRSLGENARERRRCRHQHALQAARLAWIAIVSRLRMAESIAMNTIIYISGLQTVPEDVYDEAGDLDGATGWKKVQIPDIPADHSVLHDQHGPLCEELPDGIRPDHGDDTGRTGPEHGVHLLPDLSATVWQGGSFGYQSANAVVFFIVIVAISVAQMTISSKKEEQL